MITSKLLYFPIKQTAIAVFLVLLLILVRVPFLNDTLCGEEGEFAFLVASPVPSADLSHAGVPRGLIANIGEQKYFSSFSRTIMPYVILENVVGSITRPMKIMALKNPDDRAIAVHLIFLSLFLLGSLGAIWITSARTLPVILGVVWTLTTPLAIGASIQPQLDGSVGVLLLGSAAFLLSTTKQPALLVAAGILVGLGKHEWALAFFVAAVLVIFIKIIVVKNFDNDIMFFLFGLAASVSISIMASYDDYVAGFGVMRNFYGEESPLYLARKNYQYLAPTAFVIIACGILILIKFWRILADESLILMLFMSGAAILSGFALSGHNPDLPRYFAPALIIGIYVFLNLLSKRLVPIVGGSILYVVLAGGFIFNGQYLISVFSKNKSVTTCATTMPNLIQQRIIYDEAINQNKKNQIPVISSGIWLYYPESSFIEESVARAGGEQIMKQNKLENILEIVEPMKCQLFPF